MGTPQLLDKAALLLLILSITVIYNAPQRPEQIGEYLSEVTGKADIVWEAGGVPWGGIELKFKDRKLWYIMFETDGANILYYDRTNNLINGVTVAGGAITPGTAITTYFSAKGGR